MENELIESIKLNNKTEEYGELSNKRSRNSW